LTQCSIFVSHNSLKLNTRIARHLLLLITSLYAFSLSFEATAQSYVLNGDAISLGSDCYAVTPSSGFSNGTIWYNQSINLLENFTIEFTMNFGNLDANGADGMVFVFQTQGTSAIGINGSGMGFQGFNPSFGIEFDTYSNNPQSDPVGNQNDPAFDHTAFLINGVVNHNSPNNIAGPVSISSSSSNVEDNNDYTIRISWDPALQEIKLYVNCDLRLSTQYDLINAVFGGNSTVYWGFTGSTGFYYNLQQVCLSPTILTEELSFDICNGDSQTITAGYGLETSYAWFPAEGLSSSSDQTVVASPTQSEDYTVTFETQCGEVITQLFHINVIDPPQIVLTPSTFCGDTSQPLEANIPIDCSIIWETTDGVINGGNDTNPIFIQSSGAYSAIVSDQNGCTTIDTIQIEFYPLPEVDLELLDLTSCNNQPVLIDLTNANYSSVLWTNGSTDTVIEAEPGTLGVTVSQNGCSSYTEFSINNIDVPNPSLGPDIIACEGDIVLISSDYSVTWSTGDIAFEIEVTDSGLYEAINQEEDCISTDQILVDFTNPPFLELGPTSLICPGDSVHLTAPQNVTWHDGSYSSVYHSGSTENISATLISGPCVVSDETEVILIDYPSVDLGEDINLCNGSAYTLSITTSEFDTIIWNNESTQPTQTVSNPGDIWVEITNQCGVTRDSVEVFVEECNYFIYAPNTFTPNNDGINDVWQVSTFKIDFIDISIFDRWGNLIFHTNDSNEAWMGNFKNLNHYVEDGVYPFRIVYTVGSNVAESISGHIVLLR